MPQDNDHPIGTASDNTRLYQRLVAKGWEFDFFQAVWLLERRDNEGVRVGHRGPISREPFRFRPDVSMGFSATDVRRITPVSEPGGAGSFHQIDITFLGLYGATTPLPLHYAVDLLRSVAQAGVSDDETAPDEAESPPSTGTAKAEAPSTPTRDFLDLFHHRLISLFYRTWLKYRYDRTFGLAGRDVITEYLLWLIGMMPDWDETLLNVSPIRLIRYAGLLTQHPRSAPSLEGLLTDYWGDVEVVAHQCLGRWVSVPRADRNRVGVSACRLGVDLTVGEQVYDLSGAFTLTFGPTDWTTYVSFLPGEPCWVQTCALVRHYSADPLSLTVEMRILENEIPPLKLSSDDSAARLGMTGWVRTDPVPATSVTFDASPTMWPRSAKPGASPARPDASDEGAEIVSPVAAK